MQDQIDFTIDWMTSKIQLKNAIDTFISAETDENIQTQFNQLAQHIEKNYEKADLKKLQWITKDFIRSPFSPEIKEKFLKWIGQIVASNLDPIITRIG